ncbi:protein-associating with the carboxyl-terminal domain of ezrin isoform X2 [Palaemon carinicauda]|uniref:protein-associating with the carboxyl-terminal domain of ezrin isoform X2 n=1 Tax=Palaemon carinicauda TaxID=392227 RepID=UPI0035B6579B
MGNVDSALGQLEVDRDKGEVFEDWTMAPGELGGTPVTVFSAAHPLTSRKRPYIERALQASRVYRHPGLLKYIDGGIIGGEVVVVTERAMPLLHQDLEMFSPLHISAGLLSVIETLVFLHDRAGVSHNNVSSSGIFVTSDGAWKLWGLEYSCSFGELTRDHIEHINSYCHEKSVPPDDKSRISPSYQHARDSYAFSCLVKEILSPDIITAGAEDFLNVINEKGLNKDWSQRPRLADLAKHQIFSHDFLKIHDNLSNVLLLHDHKREEFLQNVGEHLKQYPEELVSSTLAGALLSRPLLLHPAAVTHLMPMVLTPKTNDGTGGLFSERVFEKDIVPQIVRLFSVHDATVRSILLLYLPHYVHLVSEDILADEVLPELLLGIRDSSDTLVMSTLHALAHLVPILGANTVIGENRQNLFTTAKPKATPILPVNKVLAPHQVNSVKPKTLTSNGENVNFTPSLDISKESEPPPPPPRSISLAPESIITQDATPEITSLDNLSLDSLIMSQIPERSSPDGGEDSGSPTILLGVPGGVNCSDNEAWSDWEEMQDNTPSEDFSNVLLSLNQDHLKEDFHSKDNLKETGAQKIKEVSLKDGVHNKNSDTTSNKLVHNSSMKKDSGVNSNRVPKQSKGMKLTGLQFKENPENISLKKQKNNIGDLGEEFDVLAIKVKKKHDEELDLFADIVPTFSTKKYDLETMLIEAKSKSQSSQKERSPSVSETLAGLDISGAEIGEAWEEESWGEQIDFAVDSPVISRSDVLSKIASEEGVRVDTPVSSREEYNEKIKELEKFTFQKPLLSNSVTTSDEKDEWDNWGDEF